jgi:ribose transport system ATP-binding protein
MAQRQLLEIARALMTDAKVVILDEPTSSLTGEDTQMLFKIIRELKAKGISILYISHFLEEVKAIADTYTVIRDGESVASGNMSEVSINDIIELMVGRSIEDIYPNLPAVHGECILKIRNLRGTDLPMSASFELHKGEIMGIAGLVGSGRTELLRALFGLDAIQSASVFEVGKIQVNHTRYRSATALKVGFDLLSENRKEEGLALNQSIAWNTTLSSLSQFGKWGFINLQKEAQTATEWKNKLQIKANTVETLAGNLSGGNQQKIALARILLYNNHLLLLDEPTRGIDVGSKVEIYRLIQEEAAKGKAIIMVSSYLPELLGVCHTLTVMHKGRLSPKRMIADWTEQEIMLYATSGSINEENT